MGFSKLALEFTKISVPAQVRVTDRISYLYLEYVKVYSNRTGVWAVSDNENSATPWKGLIQIPVGSIAVVMLGVGTSVTQPAMAAMASAGATVMFTGGGGLPMYAAAVPLTSSARWAQAQAVMWVNKTAVIAVAKKLYLLRFPGVSEDVLEGVSIEKLRGLEGRMVRTAYQSNAKLNRLPYFKRDTKSVDPVNVGLNLGNSILYGCAASVCAALAINPALGVIHRGNVRAFLYDLADVFKLEITVPVAFSAAKQEEEGDVAGFVKRRVRLLVHRNNVLQRMFEIVTDVLSPYLVDAGGDMLVGDVGLVAAHTNYGSGSEVE